MSTGRPQWQVVVNIVNDYDEALEYNIVLQYEPRDYEAYILACGLLFNADFIQGRNAWEYKVQEYTCDQ